MEYQKRFFDNFVKYQVEELRRKLQVEKDQDYLWGNVLGVRDYFLWQDRKIKDARVDELKDAYIEMAINIRKEKLLLVEDYYLSLMNFVEECNKNKIKIFIENYYLLMTDKDEFLDKNLYINSLDIDIIKDFNDLNKIAEFFKFSQMVENKFISFNISLDNRIFENILSNINVDHIIFNDDIHEKVKSIYDFISNHTEKICAQKIILNNKDKFLSLVNKFSQKYLKLGDLKYHYSEDGVFKKIIYGFKDDFIKIEFDERNKYLLNVSEDEEEVFHYNKDIILNKVNAFDMVFLRDVVLKDVDVFNDFNQRLYSILIKNDIYSPQIEIINFLLKKLNANINKDISFEDKVFNICNVIHIIKFISKNEYDEELMNNIDKYLVDNDCAKYLKDLIEERTKYQINHNIWLNKFSIFKGEHLNELLVYMNKLMVKNDLFDFNIGENQYRVLNVNAVSIYNYVATLYDIEDMFMTKRNIDIYFDKIETRYLKISSLKECFIMLYEHVPKEIDDKTLLKNTLDIFGELIKDKNIDLDKELDFSFENKFREFLLKTKMEEKTPVKNQLQRKKV